MNKEKTNHCWSLIRPVLKAIKWLLKWQDRKLYRVQTGTFIVYIAINVITEINISYKISINYCSIKMQIVIILRKILNTALPYVRSTLSIDIWQLKCQQIKQKVVNFSELPHFSSSSFWRKSLFKSCFY